MINDETKKILLSYNDDLEIFKLIEMISRNMEEEIAKVALVNLKARVGLVNSIENYYLEKINNAQEKLNNIYIVKKRIDSTLEELPIKYRNIIYQKYILNHDNFALAKTNQLSLQRIYQIINEAINLFQTIYEKHLIR